MKFEQRMFARARLFEMLDDLHGTGFEDFFHTLMCMRYPDFLNVRTAGSLGDMGADGISLHDRKLYAVYAPQTFSMAKVEKKFTSDLAKALAKRSGQFETFVFVHNDRRGIHPQITELLAQSRATHAPIKFEQMGSHGFWRECMQLDQLHAEEVLRCPIPISYAEYSVGLEDLRPLLKHLSDHRVTADPLMPLPVVHQEKLDFNKLTGDTREDLMRGMRRSHLVDVFYDGGLREAEHDEVARGFRLYYEQVCHRRSDPDEILWDLEEYVMGNQRQQHKVQRAAWVVLAHFFERCDIFEAPPTGWASSLTAGQST
nr:hypothetical protein OH820_15760 [Streptomyces sp. NBC_00857]